MSDTPPNKRFIFPRWSNYALPAIGLALLGGMVYLPTLFALGASPKTTAVGYMPDQPVPYSHAIHVGKLGMDCRYCHYTVEKTAFAALPPTHVCMNCHTQIRAKVQDPVSKQDVPNPALKALRESFDKGTSVQWVKVHDLPDYAFFNHSAHVNRGVGCVSCHGRIDQMDTVYQAEPLSMGWCLDCHRAPEKFLRPKDQVTNMMWKATDHELAKKDNITDPVKAQQVVGLHLKQAYGIRPVDYMTSCYTCHR